MKSSALFTISGKGSNEGAKFLKAPNPPSIPANTTVDSVPSDVTQLSVNVNTSLPMLLLTKTLPSSVYIILNLPSFAVWGAPVSNRNEPVKS